MGSRKLGVKRVKIKTISDVDNGLEKFYEDAVSESTKTGVDEKEIRNWCEKELIT